MGFTIKYLAPGIIGLVLALVFLSTSIFSLIVQSEYKKFIETISIEIKKEISIELDEKTEKISREFEKFNDLGINAAKYSIFRWSILLLASFLLGVFTPIKQNTW